MQETERNRGADDAMAVAHDILHGPDRFGTALPAKLPEYYASNRSPFLEWVGGGHQRVLDVGCGAGANGIWMRQHGAAVLVGVEIDATSAAQARGAYDEVYNEPVESALRHISGPFDLVMCADVLEHLVDPWTVLRRIHQTSTDATVLAISIPNIRHIGALWRIAAGKGFEYEDEGIFDRTHLRFFTRRNVEQMLQAAGWQPERWGRGLRSRRARLLSKLTFGRSDEWLSYQWYVVARRALEHVIV